MLKPQNITINSFTSNQKYKLFSSRVGLSLFSLQRSVSYGFAASFISMRFFTVGVSPQ